MIQHDAHPSTLMVAQRMHYTAQRILHIQRTAPVALLAERRVEDVMMVNAIRGGKMVKVEESDLNIYRRD